MCWIQYLEKPIIKQAETPITVYKILLKTSISHKTFSFKDLYYYILSLLKGVKKEYYISPVMNKHYKLNQRNKEIPLKIKEPYGDIFNINEYYINEGYHSYAFSDLTIIKPIMRGLRKFPFEKPVLMECIIPKGSYYCKNSQQEIVSSNIIIKKEIYTND